MAYGQYLQILNFTLRQVQIKDRTFFGFLVLHGDEVNVFEFVPCLLENDLSQLIRKMVRCETKVLNLRKSALPKNFQALIVGIAID